jgi:hypothetical protein
METPLDKDSRVAKKAALERYVSQLAFTPHYLRGFLRRNELFGAVPLGSLQMEDGKATATLRTSVLRDPVRDSFVHGMWAGGDIQTISARQVSADQASSSLEPTLKLRIQAPTGARASQRLSYRLALHAITPGSVRAANIEVRGSGADLRASFVPLVAADEQNQNNRGKISPERKTSALTASRVPDGVRIHIPLGLLTRVTKPCRFWFQPAPIWVLLASTKLEPVRCVSCHHRISRDSKTLLH